MCVCVLKIAQEKPFARDIYNEHVIQMLEHLSDDEALNELNTEDISDPEMGVSML